MADAACRQLAKRRRWESNPRWRICNQDSAISKPLRVNHLRLPPRPFAPAFAPALDRPRTAQPSPLAKEQLQKAADLISRLARYTCEATLEAGETMDLGTLFGEDSTIRGLLFAHPGEQPAHFAFLGNCYGLLLCIGITAEELAFKHANGSDGLLAALKQQGVFPYTIPDRLSVVLPCSP